MAKNSTSAKSGELQPNFHAAPEKVTIGVDLGDR